MRVGVLDGILRRAWSADTSADPENWTPERPSHGQCAVTALVVQDFLGGRLMKGEVNGVSHYWNKVGGGTAIDLTWDQFPPGSHRDFALSETREYVLSFPATAKRYQVLRARLSLGFVLLSLGFALLHSVDEPEASAAHNDQGPA